MKINSDSIPKTIWETSKGDFEAAIARLSLHIGNDGGRLIEKLKSDDEFCRLSAERLIFPDKAFVRHLISSLGSKESVESLQLEFSLNMDISRMWRDIVPVHVRAFSTASVPCPERLVKPENNSDNLILWIVGLLQYKDLPFVNIIKGLLFELSLRKLVRHSMQAAMDKQLDWKSLESIWNVSLFEQLGIITIFFLPFQITPHEIIGKCHVPESDSSFLSPNEVTSLALALKEWAPK